MTIHRIRLLGDPVLRMRSEPVTNHRSPAVRLVGTDLKETMRDLKARHSLGRGLSAPQIGAPMRMVYIEIDEPWLLLNPEITDVGTEDFLVWDSCFSFPDFMVQVQRAYRIRFSSFSPLRFNLCGNRNCCQTVSHEILSSTQLHIPKLPVPTYAS